MDSSKSIFAIIMLMGLVQLGGGAPEYARVKCFPGYSGSLRSRIYSGYVIINEGRGDALFYYFVESERNPAEDPILLWLTGGPGCSSFTGFAYEIGPLNFDINNYAGGLPKLIPNPNSWTKVSNIIFLDYPAGTGFSYSNTTTYYVYGDFQIVAEVHSFLKKWFEEYPEFLSNRLYIGGDSYSGIPVPVVAQEIVNDNEAGTKPNLNLKGYLIGNGVTDSIFDNSQVPFAHGMALISDEQYKAANEACHGIYSASFTAECLLKLQPIIKDLSGLNSAQILEPSCYPITMKQKSVSSSETLVKRYDKLEAFDQVLDARSRILTQGWFPRITYQDGYHPIQFQLGYLDRPCPSLDKYQLSDIWANNPCVRKAIHANSESITGEWKRCTPRFTHKSDISSVVEYHRNLTKKGYRALIYSGDHDLVIPFVGTQAWIKSLGYPVVDEWKSWLVDEQIVGYRITYENNLTFATVKGGGHTAPEYKPRQSFMMFYRWISGEPL